MAKRFPLIFWPSKKGKIMTEKEMMALKVGEEVIDVQFSLNVKRIVVAKVSEVREDGSILLSAIQEEDSMGYPHRFAPDEYGFLLKASDKPKGFLQMFAENKKSDRKNNLDEVVGVLKSFGEKDYRIGQAIFIALRDCIHETDLYNIENEELLELLSEKLEKL